MKTCLTIWPIQEKIPAYQILREINFGWFQKVKLCPLFQLCEFTKWQENPWNQNFAKHQSIYRQFFVKSIFFSKNFNSRIFWNFLAVKNDGWGLSDNSGIRQYFENKKAADLNFVRLNKQLVRPAWLILTKFWFIRWYQLKFQKFLFPAS